MRHSERWPYMTYIYVSSTLIRWFLDTKLGLTQQFDRKCPSWSTPLSSPSQTCGKHNACHTDSVWLLYKFSTWCFAHRPSKQRWGPYPSFEMRKTVRRAKMTSPRTARKQPPLPLRTSLPTQGLLCWQMAAMLLRLLSLTLSPPALSQPLRQTSGDGLAKKP